MKAWGCLLVCALLLGHGAHAASPAATITANPAQWPTDPAPDWEDEPPRLLTMLV